jgi:hypothetical protein
VQLATIANLREDLAARRSDVSHLTKLTNELKSTKEHLKVGARIVGMRDFTRVRSPDLSLMTVCNSVCPPLPAALPANSRQRHCTFFCLP